MNYGWMIFGMMAISFMLRYSLFAWPNLRFPTLVRQGLHYVPTADRKSVV